MNEYTTRSTATLQSQRAFLLAEPRNLTTEEEALLRAIDAELQARKVLSIGINF